MNDTIENKEITLKNAIEDLVELSYRLKDKMYKSPVEELSSETTSVDTLTSFRNLIIDVNSRLRDIEKLLETLV